MESHAFWLASRQEHIPWDQKDFSYINLFKKAYKYAKTGEQKNEALHLLRSTETMRDFYTGSLRQINHLIQIDKTPNTELKEARWEIYKISINFKPCTLLILI